MPIEQIFGSGWRYYLVAFDGEGRQRTDDPAGLMSQRMADALRDQPVTDVFVMSHFWRAGLCRSPASPPGKSAMTVC
jgi:hypothetical protein